MLGSLGNNNLFTVTAVEPDGSFVTVAENVTTEAAGQTVAIANFSGGASLKEILDNGVIAIFPSTVPRPANADADEGGSPIVVSPKTPLLFRPGTRQSPQIDRSVDGVVSMFTATNGPEYRRRQYRLLARYYDTAGSWAPQQPRAGLT